MLIFQRRKSAADEHIFYNLIVRKIFNGIDEIFISESVCGKESGEEFYEIIIIDGEKLENPVIKNIHCGWVTEGMKLSQLALAFGANDFGGILMEEKVVRATGVINETNVRELYYTAKNAGYKLARRNTNYDKLELIDEKHRLVTGSSVVQ